MVSTGHGPRNTSLAWLPVRWAPITLTARSVIVCGPSSLLSPLLGFTLVTSPVFSLGSRGHHTTHSPNQDTWSAEHTEDRLPLAHSPLNFGAKVDSSDHHSLDAETAPSPQQQAPRSAPSWRPPLTPTLAPLTCPTLASSVFKHLMAAESPPRGALWDRLPVPSALSLRFIHVLVCPSRLLR